MDKPMLLCVIEHDIEHPKTDLMQPIYTANWLAFNEETRKVLVEVEANDTEGLEKFKEDYRGNYEVIETHELENPMDWMILVGELSSDISQDDSLKLIKHLTNLSKRKDTEIRLLTA